MSLWQLLYQHCRHLLDGLEMAEQAITNLQRNPQEQIKLLVAVTYGKQKILPLVNDFIALYGEIEATTALNNNRVDLVDGGFYLVTRLVNLQDSTLIAKQLSQCSNYVCVSAVI